MNERQSSDATSTRVSRVRIALTTAGLLALGLMLVTPTASALYTKTRIDCTLSGGEIICAILEAICGSSVNGLGEGISPVVVDPWLRAIGIAENALTATPGDYEDYSGFRILCN